MQSPRQTSMERKSNKVHDDKPVPVLGWGCLSSVVPYFSASPREIIRIEGHCLLWPFITCNRASILYARARGSRQRRVAVTGN